MPPTWNEWRAGLRAWLTTGAGPWITAGIDTAPADLDAFHRHNVATGVPRIQRLALVLMALNGVGWLTDPIMLDGIPGVQPPLWQGRLMMTVFGSLIVLGAWLPPMKRRAGAVALAWVAALGLCAGVSWTMGRIGGPSSSWFHATFAFMFVALLAWATPLHRLLLTGAMVAVMLGAYFGLHPEHLADPLTGSAMTHLAFIAAIVFAIGLRLDASRLRLFLYGRAADRQADRLEAQVDRQTARIQALLDHVERAREDERRDVAAELHDEMGQVLTGMRLSLKVAQTRARADESPLAPALSQIGEMMQHLGWAVRNLLVRLRPRVLDDLGFVAAAEWLARRTDELPGLRCTFVADPDLPTLDTDAATAGFRVLQESLTNAVRHGQPARIAVRLDTADGGVRLTVSDDGAGFAPDGVSGGGMGLMGMRERARARGGRLAIDSAPGEGTRVVLTLPAMAASAIPGAIDAIPDDSMPSVEP